MLEQVLDERIRQILSSGLSGVAKRSIWKNDWSVTWVSLSILIRSRHRPDRNPASQHSPSLRRCAILSVGGADGAHLESGILACREVIR